MAEEKKKLLGLSLADLEAVAAEMAMPRFTAKQMAQWLYEKRASASATAWGVRLRRRLCAVSTVR